MIAISTGRQNEIPTTYILQTSGLDLRIKVCPVKNLVASHAFRKASDPGKDDN